MLFEDIVVYWILVLMSKKPMCGRGTYKHLENAP